MSRKIVISGVLVLTFLANCYAQKKHKFTYEFPDAMAAPIRAEFIKICDKGQVLWEINCSRCHNKVVGKKVQIPDFRPEQLKGYELRVINPTHESDIPETSVSAEELGQIMTFLSYKKKNDAVKP